MRHLLMALTLLAAPLALAQHGGDGLTPEEQCNMKCGDALTKCMLTCTGSNPADAAKPENRDRMMGCTKKCADGQESCFNKCEQQGNKKKGK